MNPWIPDIPAQITFLGATLPANQGASGATSNSQPFETLLASMLGMSDGNEHALVDKTGDNAQTMISDIQPVDVRVAVMGANVTPTHDVQMPTSAVSAELRITNAEGDVYAYPVTVTYDQGNDGTVSPAITVYTDSIDDSQAMATLLGETEKPAITLIVNSDVPKQTFDEIETLDSQEIPLINGVVFQPSVSESKHVVHSVEPTPAHDIEPAQASPTSHDTIPQETHNENVKLETEAQEKNSWIPTHPKAEASEVVSADTQTIETVHPEAAEKPTGHVSRTQGPVTQVSGPEAPQIHETVENSLPVENTAKVSYVSLEPDQDQNIGPQAASQDKTQVIGARRYVVSNSTNSPATDNHRQSVETPTNATSLSRTPEISQSETNVRDITVRVVYFDSANKAGEQAAPKAPDLTLTATSDMPVTENRYPAPVESETTMSPTKTTASENSTHTPPVREFSGIDITIKTDTEPVTVTTTRYIADDSARTLTSDVVSQPAETTETTVLVETPAATNHESDTITSQGRRLEPVVADGTYSQKIAADTVDDAHETDKLGGAPGTTQSKSVKTEQASAQTFENRPPVTSSVRHRMEANEQPTRTEPIVVDEMRSEDQRIGIPAKPVMISEPDVVSTNIPTDRGSEQAMQPIGKSVKSIEVPVGQHTNTDTTHGQTPAPRSMSSQNIVNDTQTPNTGISEPVQTENQAPSQVISSNSRDEVINRSDSIPVKSQPVPEAEPAVSLSAEPERTVRDFSKTGMYTRSGDIPDHSSPNDKTSVRTSVINTRPVVQMTDPVEQPAGSEEYTYRTASSDTQTGSSHQQPVEVITGMAAPEAMTGKGVERDSVQKHSRQSVQETRSTTVSSNRTVELPIEQTVSAPPQSGETGISFNRERFPGMETTDNDIAETSLGQDEMTSETPISFEEQPGILSTDSVSKTSDIKGVRILRGAAGRTVAVDPGMINGTIVRHATIMVRNGESSAEIRLEPPSLGKLKLDIVTENGKITGRITVETTEVRDLIQQNLAQLRESLAQSGLKVQSFDVQVGHNGGTDNWARRETIQQLMKNNRAGGTTRSGAAPTGVSGTMMHARQAVSLDTQLFDKWI